MMRRKFNTPEGWSVLYHVTSADNAKKIMQKGLDPSRALRARRVWLADSDRVPWALAHVQSTHGWHDEPMIVLRVVCPDGFLTRHREGIFWTDVHILPVNIERSLSWQY